MVHIQITNTMKLFSCSIVSVILLVLFFVNRRSRENTKGVYVISLVSQGAQSFKFPDDSIFVDKELAVEKIMRLDEFIVDDKSKVKESVDTYYFIDFKKRQYKDIGKNLEKDPKNIPWIQLAKKDLGFNFHNKWLENENYKMKDTIYNGEKIKKVISNSKTGERYEIFLRQNVTENKPLVLFAGIEDKFKAEVIKMIITYPENKGSFIYTKKFIPLKSHEILSAMNKFQ
ncbi:hypothetical protein FLACHUCJ7_00972 [Flavobacterium chungangense]|uniref:Uncharacterized protein n=2 Tax=Flavobacterium chungangense TaxID=554283 RepID=A0A6V6YSF8_9FLAO|nr:hypothetical protein FLACHUCJ7_00972 [Flavobacterium chungangense]